MMERDVLGGDVMEGDVVKAYDALVSCDLIWWKEIWIFGKRRREGEGEGVELLLLLLLLCGGGGGDGW